MPQIVAERVREARTEGFEPGCLAALLRMEGCGVRVAARPVADDAGRLARSMSKKRSSTRSWPASGSHGSRGAWDPRATDAPHDCVSRPAVKDARLALRHTSREPRGSGSDMTVWLSSRQGGC